MISKTLLINTIQKEIRNKGVIFLFIFTILFILVGHKAAVTIKMSLNESNMNTIISNSSQTVIIYFISFCANFVAIILASTIFRSDISSRVLPQILSFPISRLSYIVSRITGAWLLSVAYFLFSLIFGMTILMTSESIQIDFLSIVGSFAFMSIELLGVILLGSFISFYGNRLMSFIITIVVYILSKSYTQKLFEYESFSLGKMVNLFMYYCTPRLGEMSYISESYMAGKVFDISQIIMAVVHFTATTGVWLYIMKTLFDKREV